MKRHRLVTLTAQRSHRRRDPPKARTPRAPSACAERPCASSSATSPSRSRRARCGGRGAAPTAARAREAATKTTMTTTAAAAARSATVAATRRRRTAVASRRRRGSNCRSERSGFSRSRRVAMRTAFSHACPVESAIRLPSVGRRVTRCGLLAVEARADVHECPVCGPGRRAPPLARTTHAERVAEDAHYGVGFDCANCGASRGRAGSAVVSPRRLGSRRLRAASGSRRGDRPDVTRSSVIVTAGGVAAVTRSLRRETVLMCHISSPDVPVFPCDARRRKNRGSTTTTHQQHALGSIANQPTQTTTTDPQTHAPLSPPDAARWYAPTQARGLPALRRVSVRPLRALRGRVGLRRSGRRRM